MKRSSVALTVAACLAFSSAALAQTESWPTRSITMINPFAAGGPNDVIARAFAQRMGEVLGQTVILENIGGAGGMNGASRVAKSAPDGYTFLLGTVGTHAQNQSLYKTPSYNAVTDFEPIGLMVHAPLVLVARNDLPANTLKELVAHAKANGDKMQYASAGTGSAIHLGCALTNLVTGMKVMHVPYRGANPAMQDLMASRVDYLCDIITTAKAQVDGKTVKPLAILNKTRSPALPNVPTAAEQGYDIEAYTWNAFFAPKGTPKPIIDKLNGAMIEAMKTPSIRKQLEGMGMVFVSEDRATPEYLTGYVKSETEKWAKPIKESGIAIQ